MSRRGRHDPYHQPTDSQPPLPPGQFIEIPALLFGLFSLCLWFAFSNFWPDSVPPSAFPLVFLVLTLLVMLNPLPIIYPSARWWMLRSFVSATLLGSPTTRLC